MLIRLVNVFKCLLYPFSWCSFNEKNWSSFFSSFYRRYAHRKHYLFAFNRLETPTITKCDVKSKTAFDFTASCIANTFLPDKCVKINEMECYAQL